MMHCVHNRNIALPGDLSKKRIPLSDIVFVKDAENANFRIGKGGEGTVYLAVLKSTGETVAVKVMNTDFISQGDTNRILKEAALQLEINHKNILPLKGVVWEKECYGLVLPYMELGSLKDFLDSYALQITDAVKVYFAKQIAQGMAHLQEGNNSNKNFIRVHQDLKLQNALVDFRDSKLCVKISDLGLCQWRSHHDTSSQIRSNERRQAMAGRERPQYTGTWNHIPPEKFKDINLKCNEKYDVYSFAIMLWEMFVGEVPFQGNGYNAVKDAVINDQRPSEELLKDHCKYELVQMLIKRCWQDNPINRPSFSTISDELEALLSSVKTQELEPSLTTIIDKIKSEKGEISMSTLNSGGASYVTEVDHASDHTKDPNIKRDVPGIPLPNTKLDPDTRSSQDSIWISNTKSNLVPYDFEKVSNTEACLVTSLSPMPKFLNTSISKAHRPIKQNEFQSWKKLYEEELRMSFKDSTWQKKYNELKQAIDPHHSFENAKKQFENSIASRGYCFMQPETPADGNCLFHALSQSLQNMLKKNFGFFNHQLMRCFIIEYMKYNNVHFRELVQADLEDQGKHWDQYINDMSCLGVWGDQIVILASAMLFECEITIVLSDFDHTIGPPNPLTNCDDKIYIGHFQNHFISLEKNIDNLEQGLGHLTLQNPAAGKEKNDYQNKEASSSMHQTKESKIAIMKSSPTQIKSKLKDGDDDAQEKHTSEKMLQTENVKGIKVDAQTSVSTGSNFSPTLDVFDTCYKMTSNPRGLAIIINNSNFIGRYASRSGSERDCKNLEKLFGNLAYENIVHRDVTAHDMKRILRSVAENEFHQNCDSFICAIMSHGYGNSVLGVDNQAVDIADIIETFSSKNCPSLSAKPKLFLINACRSLIASDAAAPHGIIEQPQYQKSTDSELETTMATIARRDSRVHLHSDLIVAYSTYPGFMSYRNQLEGSWFISTFVNILSKYADKEHIMDLLTMINAEVVKREFSGLYHTHLQQPIFECTLRKKWYLFPPQYHHEKDHPARSKEISPENLFQA